MAPWDKASLSEPQQRWFDALRTNLERETGRTLQGWAELARACPEPGRRARLRWMKQTHGLGQNRASLILAEAFPPAGTEGGGPAADPLWSDPAAQAIFERVWLAVEALESVVTGARKGYTAFSRRWQFAAARPLRSVVRLGLALPADAEQGLQPRGRESWSERLTASIDLASPEAVDDHVAAFLARAAEDS